MKVLKQILNVANVCRAKRIRIQCGHVIMNFLNKWKRVQYAQLFWISLHFSPIFFCVYWKSILFVRELSSIFGALLFGVNYFFKRRFRIIIYTNLNNCVWIINDLKQISNNRRLLELFCPLSLVGSCWICNFIKFQNVR